MGQRKFLRGDNQWRMTRKQTVQKHSENIMYLYKPKATLNSCWDVFPLAAEGEAGRKHKEKQVGCSSSWAAPPHLCKQWNPTWECCWGTQSKLCEGPRKVVCEKCHMLSLLFHPALGNWYCFLSWTQYWARGFAAQSSTSVLTLSKNPKRVTLKSCLLSGTNQEVF